MKVWLRSPERISHGTYVAAAAARITGSGRARRQPARHHVKHRPMSAATPGHHTTGLPSAMISRYEPPSSLNQYATGRFSNGHDHGGDWYGWLPPSSVWKSSIER